MVQLVDLPQTLEAPPSEQSKEYEIDQQPLKQTENEVQSQHKAEFNQKVEHEMAPKGVDVRDQTSAEHPGQTVLARPEQKTIEQHAKQKPDQNPIKKATEQQPDLKPLKTAEQIPDKTIDKRPEAKQTQSTQEPPPLLSPEQLMPSPEALAQIAQGDPAVNRTKERDVEIGDTVWLNLQSDLLVSFFRRFHDQIEMVWHYPSAAINNNEQGTLLLQIVIDKEGELIDVDLLKSSGSDRLDFEAIQSVYRGAPFGPLPSYYPHEQLKIRAHFSYRIGGMSIYGNR